jgi:branched-chain amino acid transport system substrate-binding protein
MRGLTRAERIVEQRLYHWEVIMKRFTRRTIIAAAPAALALGGPLLSPWLARAAGKYGPGVTDSEIKIGNCGPYSGPLSNASPIPISMSRYFKMINEKGGVYDRKITFTSYDDGYSPPKTVEMTRKLVESDGVFIIAGSVGTPTNTAVWHYLNEKKVPQLFPATGATKWNDPKGHPWTIGFFAGYRAEGGIYAAYILKHKPDAKIGILYQNDDYGKDYLNGILDGLGKKADSMIKVNASYETTDATVDSQIVQMKGEGCDTLIMIAIPKFEAQAIKKVAEIEWKPLFITNGIARRSGRRSSRRAWKIAKASSPTIRSRTRPTPNGKMTPASNGGSASWTSIIRKATRPITAPSTASRWPRRRCRCSSSAATS